MLASMPLPAGRNKGIFPVANGLLTRPQALPDQ